MDTENKVYETRVVPFVRYEKIKKHGKVSEVCIDNLSSQECRNMSCESKMLTQNKDHVYVVVDTPLTLNGFTGIRGLLCYVFDEMNEEEQKKYFSRSVVIPTTIEKEEKKEEPKNNIFGRKKVKIRK